MSGSDPIPADPVGFETRAGRVDITVSGRPFATYYLIGDKILRPHFAHVRAPSGIQVTRNHPPIEGVDSTDHDTMHPGLWLGFGRISGADFWRNQATVAHERFTEGPRSKENHGTFSVVNRYLANDRVICRENSRITILVRPGGTLLVHDSVFHSEAADFSFGDQQEMGLGVRVAEAITVDAGGRMVDSEGRVNEKQIWGLHAEWCDYSGVIGEQRVGVLLMSDPANFRRSRVHSRDYGVLVLNPFGREDFQQGERSRVVVKRGERFRLRFGALVHSTPADTAIDLEAAYEDFLEVITKLPKPKSQ